MSEKERMARDAVTVGQIRARELGCLERQIVDLSNLIREGYFKRDAAKSLLDGPIGETLTRLQNLDAMAATEVLFPAPAPTQETEL